MARAYICHARNDLEGHMLQILDLKPNSSQPGNVLTPIALGGVQSGQTGYLEFGPQNDPVAVHVSGLLTVTNADYYGLSAYLLDNVNNAVVNKTLTAAQANGIADRILHTLVTGGNLTLDDINAAIRAEAGVNVASTLDGAGGTRSTGSVVGILRILSGEAYFLAAGSPVANNLGDFPWVGGAHPIRGSFRRPGSPGYRCVRRFVMTGALLRSALFGALSKLKDPNFTWINPAFTYGPTGTALGSPGHIGVDGRARGVMVYSSTGEAL